MFDRICSKTLFARLPSSSPQKHRHSLKFCKVLFTDLYLARIHDDTVPVVLPKPVTVACEPQTEPLKVYFFSHICCGIHTKSPSKSPLTNGKQIGYNGPFRRNRMR